jgi:uncharacterized protein
MRILAFSDLHRDLGAAQSIVAASGAADVVVGAGDFATMGRGATDTLDILRQLPVPLVIVAGNHDRLDELRQHCTDWHNCHLLHGETAVIAGVAFFGLGFEIAARSPNVWNSHLSEGDAARALSSMPADAVLVTHTPPHGTADLQRNGEHEGSPAIRDAIVRYQPRLNLCGHIHHAWGMQGTIGRCGVYNLGPTCTWFDL